MYVQIYVPLVLRCARIKVVLLGTPLLTGQPSRILVVSIKEKFHCILHCIGI